MAAHTENVIRAVVSVVAVGADVMVPGEVAPRELDHVSGLLAGLFVMLVLICVGH